MKRLLTLLVLVAVISLGLPLAGASVDPDPGVPVPPTPGLPVDGETRQVGPTLPPPPPTTRPPTPPTTPPRPSPGLPGAGRRIVYAELAQRVWAIDSSGRIVKSHLVSGRIGNPRPGVQHVYSRSRYSGVGDLTWEFMVRFAYGLNGGRIGFHSIPLRNGKPIQSPGQLGTPLSAGCVRQAWSDALWIWNWAGIGTTVIVTM